MIRTPELPAPRSLPGPGHWHHMPDNLAPYVTPPGPVATRWTGTARRSTGECGCRWPGVAPWRDRAASEGEHTIWSSPGAPPDFVGSPPSMAPAVHEGRRTHTHAPRKKRITGVGSVGGPAAPQSRRSQSSSSTGEWRRNRVRVFSDPRTGVIQIERREHGRRITRSLGHRDWNRVKMQADEAAAAGPIRPRRRRKAGAAPGPLTLKTLPDIHRREVTSTKTD